MRFFLHARSPALVLASSALLSACALDGFHRPPAETVVQNQEERAWNRSLGDIGGKIQSLPVWQRYRLPGKEETQYEFVRNDGRPAVHASSSSSASMLRAEVSVAPEALGHFGFSWKVPSLIEGADLGDRDTDDSPARVVLAFEGDRGRFTLRESAMAELARAITGEEMPYATLMYVWCNHRPVGSVIMHPRSSRVRAIVVESGSSHLGQWTSYTRDVRADFERAFGEAPGKLVGVALMTDSDNTHTKANAWYGPLRFDTKVAGASPLD